MSKRTLALIIFLIIITGILIYIAVSPKETSVPTPPSVIKVAPKVPAETTINISPNPLNTSSMSGSLEINIDTKQNKVTAVQLEMSFDPKVLTKIEVKPGTFFSNPLILIKDIDYKNGRISYALGISPAANPLSGKGVIAEIDFSANNATTAGQTQINLLPKTLVTASGVTASVLKQTTGTTIIFGQK